ncbi:BOS complex subunit NOMO1 [Diorhabda sublineata]|uniref:BOS complex subunit NOMO1 n=1 Tax=Diorhabda sublineata TaxID=1163346 RepID=UPI0024E06684|nr:BOS complex subunit NOMO1 [Diorhabda sublineata]
MNRLFIIVAVFLTIITTTRTNEVLGCGGFLKSHVPIDFSKVEIKLITKQGIVKDKTTAAPNTGYYFVPLYDKGELLLELSPPPGWSFKPKNVALFIDGDTDLCSQGTDINFVFQGFGITGKVDSFGSEPNSAGPKGVTIQLESDGETRTTISDKDGNFLFTPVYPKNYKISISHPKWKILKESLHVTVEEGNAELPTNSLVIQGYDVIGQVKSDGESVKDTIVVLLSKHIYPSMITSCNEEPLQGFKTEDNYLCHVKTKNNGEFLFQTLPNGNYSVVTYNKRQNVYVIPESIQFTIYNNDLNLDNHFEIVGFSVSGKVLRSKDAALANVRISLNDQELTKTDSKGVYILEKVKAGTHKIKATAENYLFDEVSVSIDPSIPELPDILPSAYKVCGTVTSDHSQTIIFAKSGSATFIQSESSPINGTFCEFLSPGTYEIRVVVSDKNKEKGLQFYPLVQTVEVSSEKTVNIVFSQLKSTVFGKVQCLVPNECGNLSIVMKSGADNEHMFRIKDGVYSVNDVYPGAYEISILSNKFCWEVDKQTVVIDREIVEVPSFIQKGYTVVFISSHATKLNFKIPGSTLPTHFDLPKGRSSFCLQISGDYQFNLEGCHSYPQQTIIYKTNAESNEVLLTAQKHVIKLGIQSTSDLGLVQVSVKIATEKTERKLKYNNGIYELDILLEPGENAVVVPQSEKLFFTPPILSVKGGEDCENLGVKFVAVVGKLFKGKIIPPLDGVMITVESTSDSERLVIDTDDNGVFKFPPLDPNKEFKITAVKDSYILTGPNKDGNFLAHKLAEVIVEVLDIESNNPLSGVLLSLSGGENYRKNLQSGDDGKINFNSLSPSEYFLRPMMKEYQFEPSSKIIPVLEGETVRVKLIAKRVAYSAFGQIVSLNGEPEFDMVVVARGVGNCSQYSEETTCENTGHFRIRGLQPYCSYNVVVKEGLRVNSLIERSAPEFIALESVKEDVKDLRLIVFSPVSQMDLLVKTYADNIDHYKSLRIKLIREIGSPTVIHTSKIDSVAKITKLVNPGILLYLPSLPTDGKPYSVQLESSLQGTQQQIHYFNANVSFRYLEFNFSLKHNISDQPIKQTSAWNLIFIFGILIAAYNIELIGNLLKEKFNFNVSGLSNYIPNSSQKTVTDYYDDAQIEQIVQSINSAKKKPKPKKP